MFRKKQYDWAVNPSDKDKASYVKNNYVPLLDEGVLNFTNGNEQFDDEISFIETNGHTFGQQLIKVSDSSNTILFCADLIPIRFAHSSSIHNGLRFAADGNTERKNKHPSPGGRRKLETIFWPRSRNCFLQLL